MYIACTWHLKLIIRNGWISKYIKFVKYFRYENGKEVANGYACNDLCGKTSFMCVHIKQVH